MSIRQESCSDIRWKVSCFKKVDGGELAKNVALDLGFGTSTVND